VLLTFFFSLSLFFCPFFVSVLPHSVSYFFLIIS